MVKIKLISKQRTKKKAKEKRNENLIKMDVRDL